MKFHAARTGFVCVALFAALGIGSALAGSAKNPKGNVGIPTTTTVTSSANPSTFGNPVTFTATVTTNVGTAPESSAPSGSVTFRDGITPISGAVALDVAGQATFTTSTLATGNHNITAAYGGGGGFAASTSAILVQAVNAPAAGVIVPTLGGAGLVLFALALGAASLWLVRRA